MAKVDFSYCATIVIFCLPRGEGSLEAKLPTIWTDEAVEAGRVREEKE